MNLYQKIKRRKVPFYQRVKKDKLLVIDIKKDFNHWAFPLCVQRYPVTTVWGIHIVQIRFFCLFLEIEWYKYEEST